MLSTLFGLGNGGDDHAALDEVVEAETIADVVEYDDLFDRLPPGWTARPDVVQFGDRALSEVLVLGHARHDSEFLLAPVDSYEPTGEIDVLVRTAGRRRSLTRERSLTDAVDAVCDRIDVRESAERRSRAADRPTLPE